MTKDLDALAVAGAMSRRVLAGRLGGIAGLAIALDLLSTALFADEPAGDSWIVAGGGLLALSAGATLVLVPWRVPMWSMDAMAVVAATALFFVGMESTTIQPALPSVAVILGTNVFAVRSWVATTAHTSLLALSYALLLVFGPATDERAARWVIVMSAVATSGVFIRWLVSRLSALAGNEHRAWREAEAASADLARISRAKSEFLARMSHELRTPLNAVMGFGNLLREGLPGPLNERQHDYVNDICESAAHLTSLVDEILDPNKVEQGEVELLMEAVDVRRVIDEAVRMVHERALSRRISLDVEVASRIEPIRVDRRKLRQVVVNLLANAVKFTPPGGVVTLSATRHDGVLAIVVRDTGIGIEAGDLNRIFEEYQQSTPSREGTGLGLPLAKRFTELHGGRIRATSEPGEGSVFTVEFPYRLPSPTDASETIAAPEEHDDAAFTVPGSRANRALVAFIGSWLALNAAVILVLIALLTSLPTVRRGGCAALAAVAVAVAVAIRRWAHWLPLRGVETFGAFGIVAITLVTMYAGQFADLMPLAYGWVTMTTFALWPPRRAVGHLVAIVACYGAVLAVRPDDFALVRALALASLLLASAVVSSWLLTKLRRLLSAEQTARQRAEEIRSRLDSASRHKSAFVANMSHELRTPLNAIIGFADLLATEAPGSLTAKQRDYLADILTSARHLFTLINDILDLAKLEAGQLSLSGDVVGVESLLYEVARRSADAARARNIALVVHVGEGATCVTGDYVRLVQVLDNLVSNALKFTPDGGRVELSAQRRGTQLVLAVRDTGIGVLPEQRQSIFESFSQGPQLTADRVPEGTGVGLSLVKGLVELHGGTVSVNSVPEQGSEFVVLLPGAAADLPAMQASR